MPIVQKGLKKNLKLIKRFLGIHPIINFFIEQLNVNQIISSCIKQDDRLTLSLDQSLVILIHNILTSPLPMYEISDWSKNLDEGSVGLGENESEIINDDRIGRALTTFYNGKHKDVFFRLALRAIKVHKLNCDYIHQDTTSITLTGKYPSQEAYEKITFGKNKDHRPDLKQLVLGLSVTADGAIPLVHKVYSGNQTDDTLHIENHRKLVKLLQRTDFVYVADSKLATESNLDAINTCNGKFVSIMPRTWVEDKEFKLLVRQGSVKWEHILSKKKKNNIPGKKFDKYYLANGSYKAKSKYRLIWLKSSQKAEQDIEIRERRIQKCVEEINILSTKLNKRKLKTRVNIKNKVKEIFKKNKCSELINFKITSIKIYSKNKKILNKERKQWKNIFTIAFGLNEKSIDEESKTDGIFPLITNLPDGKKAKELLEIYKFQAFLETRNHQLKEWQMVSPALLKNPKRIVAYLHMHVMALMVAALVERKLRQGMKKAKIKSLPIYPEERDCISPTFYDLCRLFRGVEKYEVVEKENITYFPAILTPTQKKVLELLEVPTSLYQ